MNRTTTLQKSPGRRAAQLLLGAALGVALVTGCGDDDGGDEQSAQEQYCEAGDSLESSVSALTSLDLIAEGTSGLESALDDVKSDLDDVKSAGSEASSEETDALEQAVDDLGTAVSDLGGEITADNVSALATAVQNVGTAAQAVYGTLTDCP